MTSIGSQGRNVTYSTDLGYKKGKPAVLDHLVPLTERREDVPAVLLQDEADVNDEELACVRMAWQQATERAIDAQMLWGPGVSSQLEREFAKVVREQTPTAEDAEKRRGIMQALNDIVETDLPAYPGLCIKPYGSYVSGLYCPSGDLDLSIEGTSTGGCAEGLPVKDISKGGKADLLRTVSKKLERKRLHTGWIERILHARVPILKFIIQGVDCDVSIGSSNAIFKAKVFRALAQRERRFGDMLRLIKAWAGVRGLNSAVDGTFNSFALGLMLIFHLQTCNPPMLPPLHELFQDSCSAISSRPIHMGKDIAWHKLEVFQACVEQYPASSNAQGLAQHMSAFFNRFHAALLMWRNDTDAASVRASAWCGRWSYGHWAKNYIAAVEDPFDATDNCARTIGFSRIDSIVDAFGHAAAVMNAVRDYSDVQRAMDFLFKGILSPELPPVPTIGLGQGQNNKQRKKELLAREAEGRKWRQQQYARDNRVIVGRRDSGNGANGQPSPAAASPVQSATPIKLPKFARPLQGVRGSASPAPQSEMQHGYDFRSLNSPQPAVDTRQGHTTGYMHLVTGPQPAVDTRQVHTTGYMQLVTGPQPAVDTRQVHTTGYMQLVTGPSQSPTPTPGAAQLPRQLPSQSIAQSGVAQHDRSASATSQPAGGGPAPRRPPPGFGSRSGNPDARASPSVAGRQHTSSGHAASPHMHQAHHEGGLERVRHELAVLESEVAAATQAALAGQPQAVSSRITQNSAGSATAAASGPTASVPYYMPAQQANQALSDELKRVLRIGGSAASEASPAARSASEHDHTAGDDNPASSAPGSKARRNDRVRRPSKHAEQDATQLQGSATADSHCSGAAAPDVIGDNAGKPKRYHKARRQARRQGNPSEQPLHQAIPVKSAAAAFVENNLSANSAQRKPKKAEAVTAR